MPKQGPGQLKSGMEKRMSEPHSALGLLGRKVGMTRIFTDDGSTLPVTVLDVSDNRVTQIKTAQKDGYAAVQVAFGKRRATRVNKALAGHLAKAAVEAGHVLKEFRTKEDESSALKPGAKLAVQELFKVGQLVDVQGITIGKGFAGVIKRHHFHSQRASHGNSISHRTPGSTGQNQSPAHVFPGKRMPGHLGSARRTISNLEVVRIDAERQLLLVKGSVPGSRGRDVVVRPARTADVRVIRELVNVYAGKVLLAKETVTLYEDVQEFHVVEEDGVVVGCGALHVMWEDLAEVRTLAVAPTHRGRGVGAALLERLLDAARDVGVSRVFCLTFETEFFSRHGFEVVSDVPVEPAVAAELLQSPDEGVAEFLDLARVKPNTLGNTRMLLEL